MLEIQNISKIYADQSKPVVHNLNLDINEGEFFSLLGPSGCGKTTLLRMIAGLDSPSGGKILLKGTEIQNLPAQARPFNMVFQRYALFPHLSVFENVAYGLRRKNILESEIQKRASESLEMIGLVNLAQRFPETLSGGQAQRVALARALINRPQILLLDEPLSALDQQMRLHMQSELRELQKKLGLTFIYVTHDQEEAFVLSDRIAVMNSGSIEQISSPQEMYDNPKTLFVARFVGAMAEFAVENYQENSSGLGHFEFSGNKVQCRMQKTSTDQTIAMVRPEKIEIEMNPGEWPEANKISVKVHAMVFKGDCFEVDFVTAQNKKFKALLQPYDIEKSQLKTGKQCNVLFDPKDTILFTRGPL